MEAEVQYNFARLLSSLGLLPQAHRIYAHILELTSQNAHVNDFKVRAAYNLSIILKGAGHRTGITLNQANSLDRNSNNCTAQAHRLIMDNIII